MKLRKLLVLLLLVIPMINACKNSEQDDKGKEIGTTRPLTVSSNDESKDVTPIEIGESTLNIVGFIDLESTADFNGDLAVTRASQYESILLTFTDLSDISSPKELASLEVPGYYFESFMTENSLVYLNTLTFKGVTINIEDPENPSIVSEFSLLREEDDMYMYQDTKVMDAYYSNHSLYLLWDNGVLDLYDFDGSKLAFSKSSLGHRRYTYQRTPVSMSILNDIPYVIENYHPSIYKPFYQDYNHMFLIENEWAHLISGRSKLTTDNDLLYVTNRLGVAIINPNLLGEYSSKEGLISTINCYCEDMFIYNNKGYKVGDFDPEITVIDFSDPQAPTQSKIVMNQLDEDWEIARFDNNMFVIHDRLYIKTIRKDKEFENGSILYKLYGFLVLALQ